MTMAARSKAQKPAQATRSGASRIARVEILHDMREAETICRLEYPPQIRHALPAFRFLAAWLRHVGEQESLRSFIVVAYDADDQPLMLLPLAVAHENGMRSPGFSAAKHVTFTWHYGGGDFAPAPARPISTW